MRDKSIQPNIGRRRFLTGLGTLGAGALLSGCDSLSRNDQVQALLGATDQLTHAAQRLITSPEDLAREYPPSQIAPTFRANGTTNPDNPKYERLAANNFVDWRLQIGGLVRRPMQLSLSQLRAMPTRTQITRHDCVEGWSCIGKWTGAVLGDVLNVVEPTAEARYVVFFCADKLFGSRYYESLGMIEAWHPQTLLAYALNDATLPITYGAPIRLRAERQLGYKMAKYIMGIELVDSFKNIQGGHGGFWEDHGYEWWAGI